MSATTGSPVPATSPRPVQLSRLTSQSSTGTASAGASTPASKPRRARLREFYGLPGSPTPTAGSDPLNIGASLNSPRLLWADSPSFDPKTFFEHISSNALPDLMKRENDLLEEIRELHSERQSLVYNHHHELIGASDTIRKMKARAESLDASLDSLRSHLENIAQLSSGIGKPPVSDYERERLERASTERIHSYLNRPPIVNLPSTLRERLDRHDAEGKPDREAATQLWGAWEPVLTAWADAGVLGVKEIAQECREVLARARRNSLSSAKLSKS